MSEERTVVLERVEPNKELYQVSVDAIVAKRLEEARTLPPSERKGVLEKVARNIQMATSAGYDTEDYNIELVGLIRTTF